MRNGTPGSSGIAGILGEVIGVSILMTIVTDSWSHWVPIILAIIVSLRVVQRVKK